MGYTNYYHIKRTDRFPQEFINGVNKIVANSPCQLVGWDNDDLNSKPIISDTVIALNGAGANGHESFTANVDRGRCDFCKTAYKPYDLIVKAILIYAERNDILTEKFSFDGTRRDKEYRNAVKFLKKIGLY